MTFNVTYRIYLGNKSFDFLSLSRCQDEVLYQQVVNGLTPLIYEVTTSFQGEQIVNTEERVLEENDL